MKYYGKVGYGDSLEVPSDSGIWIDQITEIPYYGDVIRNSSKLEEGQVLNKDITVSNSISIIADDYAVQNFSKIKYVEWLGTLWDVTNVIVQTPRLILSLGSVYHGTTP